MLISSAEGPSGSWAASLLLHGLSAWQPVPRYPMHVPVDPDANVYAVALLLTLVSGFLFGVVPVRQVLRTNPYQIIKSGIDRVGEAGAADHSPGHAAGGANCHLRGAGHFFDGCGAWIAALAAQQLRFRATERDAGKYRSGYGRLQRRSSTRNAKAHAGSMERFLE